MGPSHSFRSQCNVMRNVPVAVSAAQNDHSNQMRASNLLFKPRRTVSATWIATFPGSVLDCNESRCFSKVL
ncbi:hypothetical protein BLOT_014175 [Blomia tropicalis]|nr:hypothetical protein BLOT_014175 [Blomia tropicalis]